MKNQTPTETATPVGVPPLAPGSPVWKVGDTARIATYNNCRWCEIIDINQGGCATVMMEDGHIAYWEMGSLETRESYLRSCHRMQDEWTGAEYKRMVALADRPFVKHPNWDEWMARATGKENVPSQPRGE